MITIKDYTEFLEKYNNLHLNSIRTLRCYTYVVSNVMKNT